MRTEQQKLPRHSKLMHRWSCSNTGTMQLPIHMANPYEGSSKAVLQLNSLISRKNILSSVRPRAYVSQSLLITIRIDLSYYERQHKEGTLCSALAPSSSTKSLCVPRNFCAQCIGSCPAQKATNASPWHSFVWGRR